MITSRTRNLGWGLVAGAVLVAAWRFHEGDRTTQPLAGAKAAHSMEAGLVPGDEHERSARRAPDPSPSQSNRASWRDSNEAQHEPIGGGAGVGGEAPSQPVAKLDLNLADDPELAGFMEEERLASVEDENALPVIRTYAVSQIMPASAPPALPASSRVVRAGDTEE